MDTTKVSEQIRALATTSPQRSKAARLRALMPAIEHALAAGLPRSSILELLSSAGLDISMAYFDVARRRIKKSLHANASTESMGTTDQRINDIKPAATKSDENKVSNSTPEDAIIKPKTSDKPYDPSAISRIRNQRVDLEAYAKFAHKGKP